MRKLALAAAAAVALLCPIASLAQSNNPSAATLSAACSAPATGCAAGQFVSLKLGDRNKVVATLTDAAFNATVQGWASWDNGTNWKQALVQSANPAQVRAPASQFVVNDSAVNQVAILNISGATDVMLAVSAFTGGTSVAVLNAFYSVGVDVLEALATAKASQAPNSMGLSTQDLKDAGRSFVTFDADGITPAASNTVVTFAKNVAGTVTGSQTTYTITSGKTFRVQAIHFSKTDTGAAATRIVGYFRLNTGGACVAGSGVVLSCEMGDTGMGTAAANQGGNECTIPIPDGLEIVGDGTKAICLSEAASGTGATLTASLVGYEY